MEYLSGSQTNGMPMPPGVMAITDIKAQKRATRTLSKAVSLHLEGKLEGAGRLLSKAIEDGERDIGLYAALGHIQYEMHDFAAAARTYAALSEIDPKHRTASFNLGVCHGNLKQWGEAAAAFRAASDAVAPRPGTMLGLGIALIHAGRPAEALTPLEKYLSLYPEHEQALFGQAVALQQTGKHAEAVEQYRKVLARNPRCEEVLCNLVAMFLDKQDHPSVRRYAEMLSEIQPDSPTATEALAALAFQDGDFAAAAQYCRTLAESAPDRFEHWFNLGVACHKMGSYENAAQAYRQAASLQPRSAQSHLNLGVAQQELNDLTGARASYETVLTIDPGQSGALLNLALVLEQQGERQWAEKLYARINEDAPEWCDASFRLGYLRLLRGDYANSAEAFEACLMQRADWPEAHLNAGIAYARGGNATAARKSFQDRQRPDSDSAPRRTPARHGRAARTRPRVAARRWLPRAPHHRRSHRRPARPPRHRGGGKAHGGRAAPRPVGHAGGAGRPD